jgi:hypothetical protein
VLSLLYSLNCMVAFELVKLMEADCDQINRPVLIPENHPLYSNQRHHQERAIIARVIRWIARGCDKKGDTQYKGLSSCRDGCLLVFCCGGVLSKLGNIVRTWLSHFSYRGGGIVGCIYYSAKEYFLSLRAQSLADFRDTSWVLS